MCSFSRISAPKIYPKINEKTIENETLFWTAFGRFGEPFCDHFGIKIASKNRSKNQYDFGSIFGWFWAPPGVHVGSPSRSGMPPGRSQDTPRRSQDAPKMLPRRSRMLIRHSKGLQEGSTHLQARIWTIFHSNFINCSLICFMDLSLIFHWFFIDVFICWDFSGSILGVFWMYSGNPPTSLSVARVGTWNGAYHYIHIPVSYTHLTLPTICSV